MSKIILTHENADFDAVAALLAAYKLNPDAVPILPTRLNQNVADFLALYQGSYPFVRQGDFKKKRISRVILVDTQRVPQLRGIQPTTPLHIIDHHPPAPDLSPHHTFTGDVVGAATTLLVEQIRQHALALNSLEATLFALGIYEDTGLLTYGTTSARDLLASAWLLEQNASLEIIRQFLFRPLNSEQRDLYEILVASVETREVNAHQIVVATARTDTYISEISTVVQHLRDTLAPSALFVLVEMPGSLQLVGRAANGVVDAGEIARLFGGGGHKFAAAAAIHDKPLEEAVKLLWKELDRLVSPAIRVADLMSYGVQTVSADNRVEEIAQKLRRIGHEGFPVVDGGRVVGLLTRREVDRVIEHKLSSLTVGDIMSSGEVTLHPEDTITTLEKRIVESEWGQIPVVDNDGKLIGIVTRTDLIKHWASTHPPVKTRIVHISNDQIVDVLGTAVDHLIKATAQRAEKTGVILYMVGGAVRDLLLYRRNLDIDFVVEGDAIHLAESLQAHYGGKVKSHRPFGTATWTLDDEVASALAVNADALPQHLDFATARSEYYEQPTALPTVYNGSIKLDLQRRDFTINTLAIQLSPTASMGRVLDYYRGIDDLHTGLIRVLHSLSFIEDPTRILRAVRFEQRLGFQIEPRTNELIQTALPMLGTITGERVRNELTLLLKEIEPERGLLKLQRIGTLQAIHPAFVVNEAIVGHFQAARTLQPPWPMEQPAIDDLYWHIVASMIPTNQISAFTERLVFGRAVSESLRDTAILLQDSTHVTRPEASPSQIVHRLENIPELALLTAWLILDSRLARERIQQYMLDWRHIQPNSDGHTLQKLGVPPGPCYGVVLNRLREARLDGKIDTDAEEQALLQVLIEEICRDDA